MLKNFLTAVWVGSGIYCLAIPRKIKLNDGTLKSYFDHETYTSIDSVIAASTKFDKDGLDVFFTIGTLKELKVLNVEKKKWQTRVHSNMDRFNTFILDIDCGEGKPYTDKDAGIDALKKFLRDTGLPRPTVVNSGGGLHVYWTFLGTEGVTAEAWHEQAAKLKKLTEHFELDADPTRTADMSSVLRMPGTHNNKRGEKRIVSILLHGNPTEFSDICSILDKGIFENDIQVPIHRITNGLPSNLNTGIISSGATVFKKCKQMARVKEIGGPVGYAMRESACSIIKFTDMEDYSLLWANDQNPSMVEQQTWNMVETSITDNPHTCARIEAANKGGCAGCKNEGSKYFKSPIALGYPVREEVENIIVAAPTPTDTILAVQDRPSIAPNLSIVSVNTEDTDMSTEFAVSKTVDIGEFRVLEDGVLVPKAPYPYKRGKGGSVIAQATESDGVLGDVVVIYDYDMFPYERVWDAHTNCEMIKLRVNLPHDKWREVYTELYTLIDLKSFNKIMATNGVIVGGTDRQQQLCTYMSAYIKHIQSISKATKNYPQLGWQHESSVFVLPKHSLHSDGTTEACGVSSALKHAVSSFRKSGTLEEWKSIINTYARDGYEPYAFGHLVGYGSLLFQFTDYHGAIVNMVGDSGSGKSTVLKTINSLFGHPDESMLTQIDTTNAKMNRIGVFNSICTTYDEITNIDPDELSQFCYAISQGRAKHRLGQDSVEKENNTRWKMILASTSNANLMNKLSSLKQDASAESLRVFEYYINSKNVMSKSEAGDTFNRLQENFGHAGEIFINYVINNQDKVRKLIKTMTDIFDKRADVPVRERYWSAIVGCTLAGGVIAHKLGLCDYDTDKLLEWAVSQVKVMRGVVSENKRDPRALLVEFMNSIIGNTLVIGGGVDKDRGLYVREEAHGTILARSEIDAGILYISKVAIRNWLTKGGSDINWVRKSLADSGILVSDKAEKTLTAGSALAKTGQISCWKINLNHPQMVGAVVTPFVTVGDSLQGLLKSNI